ncbi:hypothetical protein ACC676_38690, partial [Rhizobium ruizarguesonis]
AIGFSDKDELTGRYFDTSADNFAKTMQISVYSFTSVARRAGLGAENAIHHLVGGISGTCLLPGAVGGSLMGGARQLFHHALGIGLRRIG